MPLTPIKLNELPFLDHINIQGRFISSLMFYHQGNWRFWVLTEGEDLIEVKATPSEMGYFAPAPQSSNDVHLNFFDFIAQRASFPEIRLAFQGFQDDILNLSASLEKIAHFHTNSEQIGFAVHHNAFDGWRNLPNKLLNIVGILMRHKDERISVLSFCIREFQP